MAQRFDGVCPQCGVRPRTRFYCLECERSQAWRGGADQAPGQVGATSSEAGFELVALKRLCCGLIEQAHHDLASPDLQRRQGAVQFIRSNGFQDVVGLLGIDEDTARAVLDE